MGAPFLNFDPTAGETPPQAPTPTSLADLAAPPALPPPAPLPSATEDLRRANYGDTGAAQYDTLVQAGMRRPQAGITGMAGVPVAPGGLPGGTSGGVAGDTMSLLGDVFTGAAGGNVAQMHAQQARLAQAEEDQALQRRSAEQALVTNDFSFFRTMKTYAPQYRQAFLQEYFAKQGRPVSPAMAAMLSDESKLAELTDPEAEALMQTDPAFKNLYLYGHDKPEMMAQWFSKLAEQKAQTRERTAAAEKAEADARAEPAKIQAATTNAALETARRLQGLNMPAKEADLEQLDGAGWTMWRVPAPGGAEGTVWQYGPKSEAPPGMRDAVTNALARIRGGKATEAAQTAAAKQEATETMTTRTMRERAPKVQEIAKLVRDDLKKIQTGPWSSRLQDVLAGKIGAPNPDFITFMSDAKLLTSLLTQMHMGNRPGEAMAQKFDNMVGAGFQSADNLNAAINAIDRYAGIVAKMHTGRIAPLPLLGRTAEPTPGGAPVPAPGAAPPPSSGVAPTVPGLAPGFSVEFE